jgi:hypothetical protein
VRLVGRASDASTRLHVRRAGWGQVVPKWKPHLFLDLSEHSAAPVVIARSLRTEDVRSSVGTTE